MIGLVLSPNLFQNYVFWDLVGVSSYLLIGFWYKKLSASKAAKKAFIMNRIGDFGLLAGTIAVSYYMYQYSSVTSLATVPFSNLDDIANYLYSYTNDFVFNVVCILLIMGSIAKSAQFPLHTWLADAMEGPTPVSALIHSATMVAAGVYLIARLYPIYSLSDTVMITIAVIGLITALICAYFAITQNDLKRILAYSTNSQLGLMFLALGAGAYSGGLFHLVTHAYAKSMLFLCSGIVIHALSGQQDIRFMGGLRKVMPVCSFCYLLGCISLSGIMFSGYYSKEAMLSGLFERNHIIFGLGFLLVSLMTAFYMFRSYFVVFEGEYKGESVPAKASWVVNTSIIVPAIFTIMLGFLINDSFKKIISYANNTILAHTTFNLAAVSVIIALIGLLLAIIFYNTKIKAKKIPILYNLSYNRFYIDNFYDFLSNRIYYIFAKICQFIDKHVIDGLVALSALIVRSFSWLFAKAQTGNFQSYLAYGVVYLAIIFAVLMFAYTLIIDYGMTAGLGG
jgi:proton-translocating NADH-quinone oxidoreductase chain L